MLEATGPGSTAFAVTPLPSMRRASSRVKYRIASFERAIVTGPSPYDYYDPLLAMQKAFGDTLSDLDALQADDPDLDRAIKGWLQHFA